MAFSFWKPRFRLHFFVINMPRKIISIYLILFLALMPIFSYAFDNATSTIDILDLAGDDNATSTPNLLIEAPNNIVAEINEVLPAPVNATSTQAISTNLSDSQIIAKWEMVDDNGLDDTPADFGQILPSGKYGIDREFKVCAIFNLNDAHHIYSQIFYPDDVAFGANDLKARQGCGQMVGMALEMEKIDQIAAADLVCGKIKNDNSNLIFFSNDYSYDKICDKDNAFLDQNIAVYCVNQKLAFDDISGDYNSAITMRDEAGNEIALLTNKFTYLPVSTFEIDFENIDYGKTKENLDNVILGDQIWDMPDFTRATVRNSGNMPINLTILQNDMGLGHVAHEENIVYKTRLGGDNNPWVEYKPFELIKLDQILDLAQVTPIDFGSTVKQFLISSDGKKYEGKMDINAVAAPSHSCLAK